MIRVLAIDDEPLALQQLAAYISKIPFFQLVAQCQSAIEAREFMDREPVDAIFCDINMPDLSGMDFVKQLAVRPVIVFTTAYSEYAVEGYKVDAVDYLLKPFGFNEFQRAAMKVQKSLTPNSLTTASDSVENTPAHNPSSNAEESIFVKTDYKTVRVSLADIRYVEGMSEYLKLWLYSQPKPLITLLSMKKMEDFLPSNFMRIHRSYIVNLDYVQEVNKNRVIMAQSQSATASNSGVSSAVSSASSPEDTYLPIGDNYREQFNAYIAERYLGK